MDLRSTKPSDSGPDGIHYRMLTYLPLSTLLVILYVLNRLWQEGRFPLGWKLATGIPLLESENDVFLASTYHQIALTSCQGKSF